MFIVFEGLDGAGKTTQARKLLERLQAEGVKAEMVADPGTTPLGLAIRGILLDSAMPVTPVAQMLLFSAARAELAAHIRAAITAGCVVICDRWVVSTLVYQGVVNGINQELISDIFDGTVGLRPDLCVHLAIDVDTALTRVGPKRDRYESSSLEEWQLKHAAYAAFCRTRLAGEHRERLDATQPVEQLHENVYQLYRALAATLACRSLTSNTGSK